MRLRHRRPSLSFGILVVAVVLVAAGTAAYVVHLRRDQPITTGPGTRSIAGLIPGSSSPGLPGAGARVPVYDLASDPVFPTLSEGYAIEEHTSGGVTSQHLARSNDGGSTWRLVGAPFPFSCCYDQVQFVSVSTGYAFGAAGLAVTHNGGTNWTEAAPLGGSLQRVVPIGDDVWATYAVCNGPPLSDTPCRVELAMSNDSGVTWHRSRGSPQLTEARAGGDILARDTPTKAYIVSYGETGGGLAVTSNDGRSFTRLDDPCSSYDKVDMAVLSGGNLWMICGGEPALGGTASAKAVYRSFDGGRRFVLEASTGFGPPSETSGPSGPVGRIDYAGQLSQLATISPTRAWIGVSGVGVLFTSDSGKIWHLVDGMATPSSSAVHGRDGYAVGVVFDSATAGWAIEFHEGVWQTTDAHHWHLVDGPSTRA